MRFEEKPYKKNRIYTGRSVNFVNDEVLLPNGKTSFREYMEHPGAVAIIPFVNKKDIILVKQYRYPVRELTYELPAGKIDKGEKPAACVRRELEEETGFYAKKIKKLLSYWPTAAFSDEVIHIYHAAGLVESVKSPDDDEFIDHVVMPLAKALDWVKRGKIRDSKTVIALLYWKMYHS